MHLKNLQIAKNNKWYGIAWIVLSLLLFALLNCLMRPLYSEFSAFQIMSFRSLISFSLALAGLYIFGLNKGGTLRFTRNNLIKGLFDFLSLPLWIAAIYYMPITEVVAISFLTPIFGIIMAAIFLNDRLSKQKWYGILLAFVGAMVILKPKLHEFNIYSLLVIATCFLWASSGVVLKKLTNIKQNPLIIIVYNNIIIFLCTLPFTIQSWKPAIGQNLTLLCAVGIIAFAGSISMVMAYRLAKVSNLMPLEYLKLIFTAIIAYIMFGEVIKENTLIGSILILTAVVYITKPSYKENKKAEHAA